MLDELTQENQWLSHAAGVAGCADEPLLQDLVQQASEMSISLIDKVLDEGIVHEEKFLESIAQHFRIDWVGGGIQPENPEQIKELCNAALAIRYQTLPWKVDDDGTIVFVCYDPMNLEMRQLLPRKIRRPVRWVMSERRLIRNELGSLYGVGADTFEKILAGREVDMDQLSDQDEASVIDDQSEEASVLSFVNQIIREALQQKATDIHVEPQHDAMRIRYRIDGLLLDVPVPENINALKDSVIARLKIMSRLDVAERRTPQDGRIHLSHKNESIDVRVATIPSVEGETVSLRLLNQQKFDLESLGLEDSVRLALDRVLSLSNGVILATGPTGSGKSTSLYCFLDHLNDPETRIVTIEDPVENKLPGIVQIAVKPEVGLSFAKGLRSILRADPNIVMIGEIRDTETAEIAIRASLTGHLVFSTLHTNDAISGVSRLLDMGVEPFLVSASVRAFLAQRLLRKLCGECKKEVENFTDEKRRLLGIPAELAGVPYGPVGCSECRHTGYSGRIGIYEIFTVTPALQEMIVSGASASAMQEQAHRDGFEPMRLYGWRKVMKGLTSIEEVLSLTHTTIESDD